MPVRRRDRRMERRGHEQEGEEERETPCEARYDLVSDMMCVSARASLTALFEEDGSRMSLLFRFIRSATDDRTASLYTPHHHHQQRRGGERGEDARSYTASPN